MPAPCLATARLQAAAFLAATQGCSLVAHLSPTGSRGAPDARKVTGFAGAYAVEGLLFS